MRARHLAARGFRNLAPLALPLPDAGAAFVGPNGHGKTNLLEALAYPVLFRSMRGARDAEVAGHDEPAFQVRLEVARPEGGARVIEAGYAREGRRKTVQVDGVEQRRVLDAVGVWLAVAFLPTDVGLVSGGAAPRRQLLDRTLSLADASYFDAARRYRAALDQRNAALRQGRPEVAAVFDGPLADAGARMVASRLAWVDEFGPRWASWCEELGEMESVVMAYRGHPELVEPARWPARLAAAASRDRRTGSTGVGPHRDDLVLSLPRAPLRDAGSTGQHRTAAVALKLCELATLRERRGAEPALLLDDVFAELDRGRQDRLAQSLGMPGAGQVFVTAPREDELPPSLGLPRFTVRQGRVAADAA